MQKKVLFAVGGTGGHIFPALALAEQLSKKSVEIVFAGGNLKTNKYFNHSLYPFHSMHCGAFVSKNPFNLIKNGLKILWGFFQARNILKKIKPDLVIGFGSYHTFPLLVAAKFLQIPFFLHESNSIPGKVNRLMSPFAVVTGVQFPFAATLLKGKTKHVGMPLRNNFKRGLVTKHEALAYYNLTEERPTILVFGGSQGAIKLNELFLESLQNRDPLQIIHFTGSQESVEHFSNRYRQLGIAANVKAFETRMEMAWQAADLTISRAGAGTIAEALEFEVPTILIPFPYAADNHQEKNGEFVVAGVKGGALLLEKGLQGITLRNTIASFFVDGKRKLMENKKNIIYFKESSQPIDFSTLVLEKLKGGL